MITVNSPIEIKTNMGTVRVTVDKIDGQIFIETFQKNGKWKYKLDNHRESGKLEMVYISY